MDKLIKFRSLVNEISLQEAKLFFAALIAEGNLDFLIEALFDKFRAQIATNQTFNVQEFFPCSAQHKLNWHIQFMKHKYSDHRIRNHLCI